jgi:FG-GAP repeat protein
MRRVLSGIALVLVTLMVGAWPAVGAPSVRSAAKATTRLAARFDLNGDSFDDLAVGVPSEDIGGQADAGAVQVLYGSADGFTGAGQLLTQASPEAGDRFGTAVAKGDFNRDTFTDLAVGAPGEALAGAAGAGAVNVFYGSASGLSVTSQVLTQASPEVGDRFGAAVLATAFQEDEGVFLTVGAPGETIGGGAGAGAVNVFDHLASGRLSGTSKVLVQADPEAGDRFGAALGTGLNVGAPGEDVGGKVDAGAVNWFFISESGVLTTSTVILQPNPETGDQFGSAVLEGRFSAGPTDLAIGAPGEDVGGKANAGAVNVFYDYGSGGGVQVVVQGPGTGGQPEPGDRFGASLSVGSFDTVDARNSHDLAVGAPGEDVGSVTDAGAINVLYGGASGLIGRDQLLVQGSPGVAGQAETGDGFGASLANPFGGNPFDDDDFDANGDGVGDLAIGVGGEDVGAVVNAGAVNVLYGAAGNGLPGSGGQLLTQDSPGVADQAEAGDAFGSDLD